MDPWYRRIFFFCFFKFPSYFPFNLHLFRTEIIESLEMIWFKLKAKHFIQVLCMTNLYKLFILVNISNSDYISSSQLVILSLAKAVFLTLFFSYNCIQKTL